MFSDSCVACGDYISSGDMVCKECRRNSLSISKMNRNKKQSKKGKKDKRGSRKAWEEY